MSCRHRYKQPDGSSAGGSQQPGFCRDCNRDAWADPPPPAPSAQEIEAAANAARAKLVREAMNAAAADCSETDRVSAKVLRHAALMINDAALAKIGRMLK